MSQTNTNCCLLLPKQDSTEFLSDNGFCIVKIVGLHAWKHNLSDHNLIKALLLPGNQRK